jgi:hypothetical protein
LKKQVHSLASRKKTQQWQTLLSKLEGDFSSDRDHFFSEIVKIRRKHSPQQCSLQSVRLTYNTVTNEPEKVKRALFDLHSGMGKEDADNDKRRRTSGLLFRTRDQTYIL